MYATARNGEIIVYVRLYYEQFCKLWCHNIKILNA